MTKPDPVLKPVVQNLFKSLVRSFTPWLTGVVISCAAHFHWHVSLTSAGQVALGVGALLTVAGHALEVQWPKFGLLLGYVGAPAYDPTVTKAQLLATVDALTAQVETLTAGVNVPFVYVPGTPSVITTSQSPLPSTQTGI